MTAVSPCLGRYHMVCSGDRVLCIVVRVCGQAECRELGHLLQVMGFGVCQSEADMWWKLLLLELLEMHYFYYRRSLWLEDALEIYRSRLSVLLQAAVAEDSLLFLP